MHGSRRQRGIYLVHQMNKLAYLLLLSLVSAGNAPSAGQVATDQLSAVPVENARAAVSLRPVKWTVVGGSRARESIKGRTVPITLQADIARGLHIYSLTQKPGGPIALRLD